MFLVLENRSKLDFIPLKKFIAFNLKKLVPWFILQRPKLPLNQE